MKHTTERQLTARAIAKAYLEDNERHLERCERDGVSGGLSAFVHHFDSVAIKGPMVRAYIKRLSMQEIKHQILSGEFPLVLNKIKEK